MSPNFVRKMADLVLPHYDFHHFHFLKVFFSVQKSRSYSNLPMAALFIVESTKSKMADLVLPPPPIILPHYGFHDFLQLFLFGDTARLLAGGTSSSSSSPSTSSPPSSSPLACWQVEPHHHHLHRLLGCRISKGGDELRGRGHCQDHHAAPGEQLKPSRKFNMEINMLLQVNNPNHLEDVM